MAWLRIDDGFTSNGKVGQLTDNEFRVWIRLLCHCAKSHDPSVDSVAIQEVSGLTKAKVSRYASLDLLDPVGTAFEVHDWLNYLPKGSTSERQARWRARRDASTPASTGTSTKTSTRARARADSRPVPSLSTSHGTAVTSYEATADPVDVKEAIIHSLREVVA